MEVAGARNKGPSEFLTRQREGETTKRRQKQTARDLPGDTSNSRDAQRLTERASETPRR